MMSQDKTEQKSGEHQEVCWLPSDTAISVSHPLTFHEPQKLSLLEQAEVKPSTDFRHICDSVQPFHTAMQNVDTV